MTGCRHSAKNTLPKNYLGAGGDGRRRGPPAHHGDRRRARAADGGYAVDTAAHRRVARKTRRTFTADARRRGRRARYNTQKLLHRMKDDGSLPRLSPRARRAHPHQLRVDPRASRDRQARRRLHPGRRDHSSFHPTSRHPRRAGALRQGVSNAMGLLHTVLTDATASTRCRRWTGVASAPWRADRGARALNVRARWSERAIIALVMQPVDNSLTATAQARPVRQAADLTSRATAAEPDLDPGRPTRPRGASPRRSTASPAATWATSSTPR